MSDALKPIFVPPSPSDFFAGSTPQTGATPKKKKKPDDSARRSATAQSNASKRAVYSRSGRPLLYGSELGVSDTLGNQDPMT